MISHHVFNLTASNRDLSLPSQDVDLIDGKPKLKQKSFFFYVLCFDVSNIEKRIFNWALCSCMIFY